MKRAALDSFACPQSKAKLSLVAFDEEHRPLTEEERIRAERSHRDPEKLSRIIREGVLFCEESRAWYPIINYVPILLDYPTPLHQEFAAKFSAQSNIFSKYAMPNGTPRPGEEFVQKSFTTQWRTLEFGDISFGLTPEQRDEFIRIEFDWPAGLLDTRGLRLLEVGCGSGFETLSLDRVTGADIVGVDLNLSLLRNGPNLKQHPFANVAIASLFALPARPGTFDIVYSSGCLHHTYSTKAAFDEVYRYLAADGLIYIWLYAREDVDYSIPARVDWIKEELFRPRLARMPDFWQNVIVQFMARRHYRMYRRIGTYSRDLWTLRSSEHFIRDRWTALYAYRHSFNEVITWFREKGLEYKLIDPKRYYDYFKVPLIGIGIRGMAPSALSALAARSRESERASA